jgi:hypothetical protein
MNIQDLFGTLTKPAKCEHLWVATVQGVMMCSKCGYKIK